MAAKVTKTKTRMIESGRSNVTTMATLLTVVTLGEELFLVGLVGTIMLALERLPWLKRSRSHGSGRCASKQELIYLHGECYSEPTTAGLRVRVGLLTKKPSF